MFLNFFKKKDPIEAFWQYFQEHEKELYSFRDEDIDKLFGELHRLIKKVNNQLVFSMPKQLLDDKREFTISGSGIGKNFPDVIRLVEAAPKMERFTIIAFNQRNDDEHGTTSDDIEITRDDVFFDYMYEKEREAFFLSLYIKGFEEKNDNYYAVVLDLLEIVIGEYTLGTEIAEIEFKKFINEVDLLPINDLPKILEDIKKGIILKRDEF
ncbi:hypothetical protein KD050_00565 [Psychrobacillus sp. INOP01]|uniref:hypothetical protein n=1 Tax=Psychrobacillus sp. INOP01 TaxID=2829187 RepID=UPI001BA8DA3F|nr:hypothetical protein [Psychrobacillus sp. INOP01]QUG41831.1 hypothetical protein KD050_00565 [Psychrobacillus sp. INOP01]